MSRRTPQSETKRPTRDEYELRVELVATLISKGKRDGQIKRMMRKQFDVSPRTVQSYLARAREQLRARRNRSREDLQAESLAFYESVIADDKASNYEKLMAARRRDLLLGLEEPKRHEHSGPAGGPIQTQSIIYDDDETYDAEADESRRLAAELSGLTDEDDAADIALDGHEDA